MGRSVIADRLRGAKKSPVKNDQIIVSYHQCPAKTYLDPEGKVCLGHNVVDHCQIVGEVARELIRRYPDEIRNYLFPDGAPLVAAAHDIGKVSPYFVEKIRRACTGNPESIPPKPDINPDLEKQWGGHAGVSQITAKAVKVPEYIAEILGQHHGFAPPVAGKRASDEIFGGAQWQQEREALVTELKSRLHMDWPHLNSFAQARMLGGLVSVADWIGSGEFFENPENSSLEHVKPSIDAAGLIPPAYRAKRSFKRIFGFSPYRAQQQLIDMVDDPGVYILEAPMGIGKTEAALYAAYQMLDRGLASGIYFALPTQLTSNKIFERFEKFLVAILAKDCPHRSLLLHTNAWMLTDMGEEGRPGGAWFNQSKRGLLAPFAVGTIDQALMAAMNVKHGFVRAFGLAGKVVILDEVHTYDAYTSTLLDALVAILRELHCTVIILSATLNRDRRAQIIGIPLACDEYPLITSATRSNTLVEHPVPINGHQKINLLMVKKNNAAIEEALMRASGGQQVLWVENTVSEAQERYLDIADRAGGLGFSCGLLHSRFTADDRQRIEDQWVNRFGKSGWSERRKQGSILVGTQVLEQSLNIDADFLITRFAPSDMLLQRLGRLWRHQGTPRPVGATCEAWLLAPDLEQAISNPVQAFRSTAYVYAPYVLCRSLEVWLDKSSLNLPDDIRPLIEQTYANRPEYGSMARWLKELDEGSRWRTGRNTLRQLARVALSEVGDTQPEVKAQTRHSETDSYEVLLIKELIRLPDQRASRLTLLNGRQLQLPWARHVLSKAEWRKLSSELMRQVVRVPVQYTPRSVEIATLKQYGFQHCFYLGNPAHDEAILRVMLVDDCGKLIDVQNSPSNKIYLLEYRDDLGCRAVKGQGQQ